MRYMLSSFNASTPLHLGFKYKNPAINQGFMSGGPGYILTKETIRRFVETAFRNENSPHLKSNQTVTSMCSPGQQGLEDFNLGINI